jgi:hypothetical protein
LDFVQTVPALEGVLLSCPRHVAANEKETKTSVSNLKIVQIEKLVYARG